MPGLQSDITRSGSYLQKFPGVDRAQEPIWKIPPVLIAPRKRGQTL